MKIEFPDFFPGEAILRAVEEALSLWADPKEKWESRRDCVDVRGIPSSGLIAVKAYVIARLKRKNFLGIWRNARYYLETQKLNLRGQYSVINCEFGRLVFGIYGIFFGWFKMPFYDSFTESQKLMVEKIVAAINQQLQAKMPT